MVLEDDQCSSLVTSTHVVSVLQDWSLERSVDNESSLC